MIVDARLERLYEKVELVKGAGDPSQGKLCVMSFVALLAGEGHSDRPRTASPLIRELVVRVNDAMPRAMRQDLKPFVPRIVGTNDGRDAARASVLRSAVDLEILPRICKDFLGCRASRRWRRMTEFRELSSRLVNLTGASDGALDPQSGCKLAEAVASLLCFCAAEAPEPATRRWYWAEAVELLDRCCCIAQEGSSAAIDDTRFERIEHVLTQRERADRSKAVAGRTAGYLRAILTWTTNAF
ncbi:MAG: hypothetical protein ACREFP_06600 [Acetobacteraceae bacterium]